MNVFVDLEIGQMRRALDALRAENDEIKKANARLKQRNDELEKQLEFIGYERYSFLEAMKAMTINVHVNGDRAEPKEKPTPDVAAKAEQKPGYTKPNCNLCVAASLTVTEGRCLECYPDPDYPNFQRKP